MSTQLPLFLVPDRLADNQKTLAGTLALRKMPRLLTAIPVQDSDVEVKVDMAFDRDENGLITIYLKIIDATLILECQRSLDHYPQNFDIATTLSPIQHDSEAARVEDSGYEPLLLEEDTTLSVVKMVEDELLLALPIVPKKSNNDCTLTNNQAY